MLKRSALFVALVFLALLPLACRSSFPTSSPSSKEQAVLSVAQNDDTGLFLEKHWRRPLMYQGPMPPNGRYHGINLSPQSCAQCHVEQYKGWRESLHAQAMGPGVFGQLIDMAPHARSEHQACLTCHAPLQEQAESLLAKLEKKSLAPPALHESGVSCAACHVRDNVWFGPPRRDGSTVTSEQADFVPHRGWRSSLAFEDSRFCSSCHQFSPEDPKINGKLIENTFEEWRESRYAKEGRTCQKCHMPDRQHLFRGIHDPDMVKQGITISESPLKREQGFAMLTLSLENTGVGHRFPTYVTPKVIMEIVQEDRQGRAIKGTRQSHVIAREITVDLETEIRDTRLAPEEKAVLTYRERLKPQAQYLVVRVRVEPDEFYTRFYQTILADGTAQKGKGLIRQALRNSLASHFDVYRKRHSIK